MSGISIAALAIACVWFGLILAGLMLRGKASSADTAMAHNNNALAKRKQISYSQCLYQTQLARSLSGWHKAGTIHDAVSACMLHSDRYQRYIDWRENLLLALASYVLRSLRIRSQLRNYEYQAQLRACLRKGYGLCSETALALTKLIVRPRLRCSGTGVSGTNHGSSSAR